MSEQDKLVIERKAAAAQICADPAFAALEASGAPIIAATGEPLQAVYLNESARAVFGDDLDGLSRLLFRSDEPGARRLCELVASIRNGAAPRLERLRFSFGPIAQTVTILCRNVSGCADRQFFVIAALGVRPTHRPKRAFSTLDLPVDAPAGESRAALAAEHAASAVMGKPPRPERFLWRTDAAGRIVDVTPALAGVVGRGHGELAGRDFLEAARSLRLDPEGRLAEALALRRSWNGVELNWPLEGKGARVPVTLGALPVFDDTRRFGGFQGYGVLHVDRLTPEAPAEAPPPEQKQPPAPAEDRAAAAEPLSEPPTDLSSANVVPLRPQISPQRADDAEPRTESDALTANERTAFDEIARALALANQRPSKGSVRDLLEAIEHAAGRDERSLGDSVDAALARRAPAILDHLPVGVLVARDAQALFANRTLLDYLGYADLDALQTAGGLARVFFGRRPQDFAERTASGAVEVQARDGETLDVDARLQTIDWDGGPATLITLRSARALAVSADVSRLSALQTELSHSRRETEELRATLDATADAVAIVDRDGRLRSVNRPLGLLFGDDPETLIGASVASLFSDADQGPVADYLRRTTSGGAPGEGLRVSGRTRKGEFVPIQFTLAPIGPPQDQKRCAILRDLGPRRRSDDQLEAARREAERANAAKSDFLAKVSHEIRTPLNAIIGFAEVMMEERFGPMGNKRYKEYLKDIHTSGAHVLSLVNDLLDLSKIEAGKMELDVERIDANAVIAECVSIMQPQASRSRVVIRLSLWPRLPRILADGRSLRQILLNLLSNAIKFNETGGQVIVSSALTDAGFVVIRVKDTGIGMSESEIETALEPFRQISTSRKVSGTGLGLPVTKALIEANHASFSIKSRKNEGTLVEVAFPPPQVLAAE